MTLKVKNIVNIVEEIAPLAYALPDDPSGLQLGHPEAGISTVLVALDPDIETIEEAVTTRAEMIVTHHPLFFDKLSGLDESRPHAALVAEALRRNLNIYSAHTSYDIAPGGVTYQLANTLQLPLEKVEVLEVTGAEKLLKLVVFVPLGYEDPVRDAISEAGAGWIGNYSHCTFQTGGTGTFMPREGTDPFIGSQGRLEKVDELRIETILPAVNKEMVI